MVSFLFSATNHNIIIKLAVISSPATPISTCNHTIRPVDLEGKVVVVGAAAVAEPVSSCMLQCPSCARPHKSQYNHKASSCHSLIAGQTGNHSNICFVLPLHFDARQSAVGQA